MRSGARSSGNTRRDTVARYEGISFVRGVDRYFCVGNYYIITQISCEYARSRAMPLPSALTQS